jgi:hypothetical protein
MGHKEVKALMAVAIAAMIAGAPLTSCKSSKSESSSSSAPHADKHACKGMNSCKGQGGCKTGNNGCAGKNSCKGNGGCGVPMKH